MGVFLCLVLSLMGLIDGHVARWSRGEHAETISRDPFEFSCPRWRCEHLHQLVKNGGWDRRRGYYDQMGCACDQLCPFFNDCCVDFRPRENNDSLERFTKRQLQPRDFSCVKINPINSADFINVVDKCPDGKEMDKYREHFEKLCRFDQGNRRRQSFLSSLPVTGRMSHAIYRNVFCALCHNEPFLPWFPEISCSSKEGLLLYNFHDQKPLTLKPGDLLLHPRCFLNFRSPNKIKAISFYRTCHPYIDTCRHPERVEGDVDQACTSGTKLQMVHRHFYAFKNPFCAKCFVGNMSFVRCSKPAGITGFVPVTSYPLSILFDVTEETVVTRVDHSVTRHKTGTSCGQVAIYDPFSGTCREILCPGNTSYDGMTCVDDDVSNSTSHITNATCPLIEFNNTEFVYNGSHIRLLDHDIVFPPSFISKTREGIRVCQDETGIPSLKQKPEISFFHFSRAESIVSVCGMCISIIALILNTSYFLKMKTLRKMPNKCILSLTISLLLAYSLLLVGPFFSGHPDMCKVVSILMHCCFLSVFMWMNVMAVDIWITFSRLNNFLEDSTHRFRQYCLYAWLLPLLIVLTAVTLDTMDPDNDVSPRYGLGLCWIASQTSLTIFFATPLALVLLVNLSLFVMTARTLYRTQLEATQSGVDQSNSIQSPTSSSSTSSKRHGKTSTMFVYVKLTVIVGLTWMLAFVMMLWPSPFTTYAFIIVNSLHGLFILITCLSTRFFRRKMSSSIITLRFTRVTAQTSNSSVETKASNISTPCTIFSNTNTINSTATCISTTTTSTTNTIAAATADSATPTKHTGNPINTRKEDDGN